MPNPLPPVDIVVVDNLDVVRRGLATLAQTHAQAIRSVQVYADIADIDFSLPPPHVVVLDYWLGREDRSSLAHVPALKQWGARIVLYTTEERPHPVRLAMATRVDGLCLKNDGIDALVDSVQRVGLGQIVLSSPLAASLAEDADLVGRLTPAEHEVLQMLRYGLTHEEIAAHRNGSVKTVQTHVAHIRDKFAIGLDSSPNGPQLIDIGHRRGELDPRLSPERPEGPSTGGR